MPRNVISSYSIVPVELNTQPFHAQGDGIEGCTDRKTITDWGGSNNGTENFNIMRELKLLSCPPLVRKTHLHACISFSISPLQAANPREEAECDITPEWTALLTEISK